MRFLLITLLWAAPAMYCIADALQHRDHEPYGLPKVAWVLILLLFPIVGAGSWFVLKFRSAQASAPRSPRTRRLSGHAGSPDDDPEFLRWLREQERRKKDQ